jgi:hypothetical protein
MSKAEQVSRFIYITGCDGTGKSTQAQLVLERLRGRGIDAEHLWLRFPFFLVAPLLLYARWRGYSWYEETEGVRQGYWDFRGSWLLRTLFPWLLLIDATFAAARRVYLPLLWGRTIVCERFVLDMVVDLAVACGGQDLHRQLPGRLYRRLLPKGAMVVVLDLDLDSLRGRRKDLALDRQLANRLSAFRRMSNDDSFKVLSAAVAPELLADQILLLSGTSAGLADRAADMPGQASVGSAGPKGRVPWLLLARHWLVQGLAYMDPTERWFKIAIDGVLTALIALAARRWMSDYVAWPIGFVLAHTLNWLLNGQVPILLAKSGTTQITRSEFDAFVQQLSEAAVAEPAIAQIVVCGSTTSGDWSPNSDLDARIIRRSGLWNGLRACTFLLRARTRALAARFPLDMYVLDSADAVTRHIGNHEPYTLLIGKGQPGVGIE